MSASKRYLFAEHQNHHAAPEFLEDQHHQLPWRAPSPCSEVWEGILPLNNQQPVPTPQILPTLMSLPLWHMDRSVEHGILQIEQVARTTVSARPINARMITAANTSTTALRPRHLRHQQHPAALTLTKKGGIH